MVSAGVGSFWLTLATKSSAAWKTLAGITPLFFDEGRQAVVERVRAGTELAKLEVDKKRFDNEIDKAESLIKLYNNLEKIKDASFREIMRDKLTRNLLDIDRVPPVMLPGAGNPDAGTAEM